MFTDVSDEPTAFMWKTAILLFDPEDGGCTLFANVSKVVPVYTASQGRTVPLT
jgi:hypothetical protein